MKGRMWRGECFPRGSLRRAPRGPAFQHPGRTRTAALACDSPAGGRMLLRRGEMLQQAVRKDPWAEQRLRDKESEASKVARNPACGNTPRAACERSPARLGQPARAGNPGRQGLGRDRSDGIPGHRLGGGARRALLGSSTELQLRARGCAGAPRVSHGEKSTRCHRPARAFHTLPAQISDSSLLTDVM